MGLHQRGAIASDSKHAGDMESVGGRCPDATRPHCLSLSWRRGGLCLVIDRGEGVGAMSSAGPPVAGGGVCAGGVLPAGCGRGIHDLPGSCDTPPSQMGGSRVGKGESHASRCTLGGIRGSHPGIIASSRPGAARVPWVPHHTGRDQGNTEMPAPAKSGFPERGSPRSTCHPDTRMHSWRPRRLACDQPGEIGYRRWA